MANLTMDKLVALAKNRGFVFPGSEIYGGLANTWDYGPLGVELKNNIKKAWWKKFITESEYNVGLDCAILMNPKVWEASGHIGGFSDPLMDCKACKSRHRADDLIENWNAKKGFGCWPEVRMRSKPKSISCSKASKGSRQRSKARWKVRDIPFAFSTRRRLASMSIVPSSCKHPITTPSAPSWRATSMSASMRSSSNGV